MISCAKEDPEEESMDHEIVKLAGKQARGYVIPLGPVNLVCRDRGGNGGLRCL